MQINKLIKGFMMALCIVALSVAYVGCNETQKQITRLYIDDASVLTVEQDTTIDDFVLVVKGMYPDSTEIDILKSDLTITGWDTTTPGEKTLTVSYKVPGTDTVLTLNDITLTVIKKIQSISYKAGSTESTVEKGEALSYTGLKIVVTYTDNTTDEIAYDSRTMQVALDTSTVGPKTMTITYMGKTATTTITVIELTSIALASTSTMSTTAYQYVPLDTTGAIITATYSDDSTKTISAGLTFSGINTKNAGAQNLVIGYKGLSTPNIVVTVKEVTAIAYKEGLADVVNQGTQLAKAGLKLTATYEGATKTLEYSMIADEVTFTGYDTSVAGNQTVTITLGTLTTSHDITVVTNNGVVLGFEMPETIARRQITQNTYTDYFDPNDADHKKGFAEVNHTYVVGNQNEWKFMPKASVYVDGQQKEPETIHTSVKLYTGAEATDTALISDENLANYVTIDNLNYQTYKFTAAAAEQGIFTIRVEPYGNTDSRFVLTFTIKVINGYNVYNTKDFSILDNMDGASSDDNNAAGKWTTWRNQNDVEFYNNITPNDVSAIVLQSNLNITAADVPSVQFWDKDSKNGNLTLEQAIAQNVDLSTYNYFKGSVKDRMGGLYDFDHGDVYSEFVYTRKVDNGTFTIEGNYYRLSIEDYPRVQYITADGSVFHGGEENKGTPITTHATMFSFQGKEDSTQAMTTHFVMRDINLMGNAGRTENVQDSGGLLGIKKKNAEMTIENVLSQKWFINFMNDEGDKTNDKYNSEEWNYANSLTLKKVNVFDSYNTLIYNWSGALNIEDSNIIGAGGPVMICDHVGNKQDTGAGGSISQVTIKDSVLQSWVAGTEGWFVSYGATALATAIKATDASYATMSNNTKTILKEKNGVTLMNLIAVFKSGSTEGISTSQIRGTFDDISEDGNGDRIFDENIGFRADSAVAKQKIATVMADVIAAKTALVQGTNDHTILTRIINDIANILAKAYDVYDVYFNENNGNAADNPKLTTATANAIKVTIIDVLDAIVATDDNIDDWDLTQTGNAAGAVFGGNSTLCLQGMLTEIINACVPYQLPANYASLSNEEKAQAEAQAQQYIMGLILNSVVTEIKKSDKDFALDMTKSIEDIVRDLITKVTTIAVTNEITNQVAATLMGLQVMQTFNGGVCAPGETGFVYPDAGHLAAEKELFVTAHTYTNMYLFNGMGTVFGLNDVSA